MMNLLASRHGSVASWLAMATVLASVSRHIVVHADKDDSYYMAGSGNPNVNEKMYWKDADNVLQDLSQFKELYVEFSHCAWTWMQMEEADNDVDENDYWYMGKIPPMGANVAYSLYGSLKGSSGFSGCNANTFINSFYTNTGFQDYAKAMYHAGQSGFSSYSYDDDSSGGLTADCSGGYGVGCDATYGFAIHTYSTQVCNPAYVTGVKDSLSSLNSAMQATKCVKIYDSSSSSSYYNANNYNNNNNGDDDGGSAYSGTALALLYYSSACFYQNYYSPDGECPDPYGIIAKYRQNFARGLQRQRREQPYVIYTSEVNKGKTMVATGSLLLGVALVLIAVELYMSRKYKVKHKVLEQEHSDGLVKSSGGGSAKSPVRQLPPISNEPDVVRACNPPPPPPPARVLSDDGTESSYSMLASMKQSANRVRQSASREMEYRMAIFNGNVDRIRTAVTRVCSWEQEPTQGGNGAGIETSPSHHTAPMYTAPTTTQATTAGLFTQITPSPLPSHDDGSLSQRQQPAMPTMMEPSQASGGGSLGSPVPATPFAAPSNQTPPTGAQASTSVALAVAASASASAASTSAVSNKTPTGSASVASAAASNKTPTAAQASVTSSSSTKKSQTSAVLDTSHDAMYDQVLLSRASLDQGDDDAVLSSPQEPSVELTALGGAGATAAESSTPQQTQDNAQFALEVARAALQQVQEQQQQQAQQAQLLQDEVDDNLYPVRSRESVGDMSNASSTRMDEYLDAKMDAALESHDDADRPNVVTTTSSGASDTEAVLVNHEDANDDDAVGPNASRFS